MIARALAAALALLALLEIAPAIAQPPPAADRATVRRRTAQLRAICVRRRREARRAPAAAPVPAYQPPDWLRRGASAPGPDLGPAEVARRVSATRRQLEMLRPSDPRHGEALVRLAELQVIEGDAAAAAGDQLRRDRSRAEATQTLEEVLRLHPTQPRLDVAVLLLARVLEALGERPRASWVLRDWANRVASLAGAPYVWVAAADLFAADGQTATALTFYERALAVPPDRAPIHAYARYRHALLLRDLGDRREAAAAFVDLMIFLDAHAATIPDHDNLRAAIDRDLCTAVR